MNSIDAFLEELKINPNSISFAATIAIIDTYYDFEPVAFHNGKQFNAAGANSGSCKIFAFAQLHQLPQEATLACFGAYYFEDVLQNPEGTDHQNIRNFMQFGRDGIRFEGQALRLKEK